MKTSLKSRVSSFLLVFGALSFSGADLLRRLVVPAGNPDTAAITHAVAQHQGLWLVASLLAVVAGGCLAVGALALIPHQRARGSRATTLGAIMLAIGAMASIGHAVAFYSPYALFALVDASAGQITALDRASESSPLLLLLILAFMVGLMPGSIILFTGLRRARRIPLWALVAVVVFVVCGSANGVLPGVLGLLAAVAAFIPAATDLYRVSPEPGMRRVDGSQMEATS